MTWMWTIPLRFNIQIFFRKGFTLPKNKKHQINNVTNKQTRLKNTQGCLCFYNRLGRLCWMTSVHFVSAVSVNSEGHRKYSFEMKTTFEKQDWTQALLTAKHHTIYITFPIVSSQFRLDGWMPAHLRGALNFQLMCENRQIDWRRKRKTVGGSVGECLQRYVCVPCIDKKEPRTALSNVTASKSWGENLPYRQHNNQDSVSCVGKRRQDKALERTSIQRANDLH